MTAWQGVISVAAMAAALTLCGGRAAAQQKTLPKIGGQPDFGLTPPVGTGACSASAPSCADVAPAIFHSALGNSPLAADLRELTAVIGARPTGSPVPKLREGSRAESPAVPWAVEAFRKAGVDEVHVETDALPARSGPGAKHPAPAKQTPQLGAAVNVVAEIRGRGKPAEFVILAAQLDAGREDSRSLAGACTSALVIDAARAIHAAGARPLRSIRFILFTGGGEGMTGVWAYARAHRAELARADAAIVYQGGCGRVIGYDLEGRPGLQSRLSQALNAAPQIGDLRDAHVASLPNDGFDFLLEGVPTLVARFPSRPRRLRSVSASAAPDGVDLDALKHAEAVAALTAYAIADSPERLGGRETRAQIQALLSRSGLAPAMKALGIWRQWQEGERGRRP